MISVFLSQYISLTKIKIKLASYLYQLLRLFLKNDKLTAQRNGINLQLDLSEGIDLSVYLFGNFQNHIVELKDITLSPKPKIIDIGANVGIMSLNFAKLYPDSTVYSFEPTDYAIKKFIKNTELNPVLKKRIHLHKAMVSDKPSGQAEANFYSSWKLDKISNNSHKVHLGTMEKTSVIDVTSIDHFVKNSNLKNVDLIKIDTDGSELAILNGGVETIEKFNPVIIFEVGLYLLRERDIIFDDYLHFFEKKGYKIFNLINKKQITLENYRRIIPNLGTTDLIAKKSPL